MIPLFKFKIEGHSMEPTISNGSIIFVSNLPYLLLKPRVGDIIAFKQNNKILVKRLIKIDNKKYFVKGDNTKDSLDSRKLGWVERKEILGKVVCFF